MNDYTRRQFVAGLAACAVSRRASAGTPLAVVLVLLRGAADGLGIAPPLRDTRMSRLRPQLDVSPDALRVTDTVGLHPALVTTHRRLRAGEGALVLGVGPGDGGRSHFEAQDALEQGGVRGSGWLNRFLAARNVADPLGGVALSDTLPLSLSGTAPSLSLANPARSLLSPAEIVDARRMYQGSADPTSARALAGLDAVERIARLPPGTFEEGGDVAAFRNAGTLLSLGTQAVFLELNGWDTHVRQGTTDGQLARRLAELDRCLDALLLQVRQTAVVMVMTEFGRTAAQNGSGGSDHGHGTAALVFGSGLHGPVIGAVPDLGDLHDGRDLPVVWTHAQLMASVSVRLGVPDINGGATPAPLFGS